MLDFIKQSLHRDQTVDIMMEAVGSSDVRDIFLNNLEMAVVGADNDPEIKRLIDNIPAYEETDPEFEKELRAVTESFVPETDLKDHY